MAKLRLGFDDDSDDYICRIAAVKPSTFLKWSEKKLKKLSISFFRRKANRHENLAFLRLGVLVITVVLDKLFFQIPAAHLTYLLGSYEYET